MMRAQLRQTSIVLQEAVTGPSVGRSLTYFTTFCPIITLNSISLLLFILQTSLRDCLRNCLRCRCRLRLKCLDWFHFISFHLIWFGLIWFGLTIWFGLAGIKRPGSSRSTGLESSGLPNRLVYCHEYWTGTW